MFWKKGQAALAVLGVVAAVAVVGMVMLYGGNSGPTAAVGAEQGLPEGQGGGLIGCAPAECHRPTGSQCALSPSQLLAKAKLATRAAATRILCRLHQQAVCAAV